MTLADLLTASFDWTRWGDLVWLTVGLWAAGVLLALLMTRYLGKGGAVASTALLLFCAAPTYLGWLTWYQVETHTTVPHSMAWLLVIYTMFSVALLMILPVFKPSWQSAIISAGIAVAISYFCYSIFVPFIVTSATGCPIVLAGQWLF